MLRHRPSPSFSITPTSSDTLAAFSHPSTTTLGATFAAATTATATAAIAAPSSHTAFSVAVSTLSFIFLSKPGNKRMK